MLAKVIENLGLRRGVDEVFAVLICYAVHMDSCFAAFRNSLSVSYRMFKYCAWRWTAQVVRERRRTTTNVNCVTTQKGVLPRKTYCTFLTSSDFCESHNVVIALHEVLLYWSVPILSKRFWKCIKIYSLKDNNKIICFS